jgi:hypothetical protein
LVGDLNVKPPELRMGCCIRVNLLNLKHGPPEDWSVEVKNDVLQSVDTLTGALSALGPDMAKSLAPVRAATVTARRHLGLLTAREPGRR